MTGPGGDALFKLRWEQENAQVPAQARAALLGLAQAQQGVTQASRQAVIGWPTQSQILQSMQRDAQRGGESLKKMGQDAERGGAGLGHVQRAMSMVAFEAAGTSGPVGHLANALVLFGAGSALTIGAAAGLAVIALGYRQITKDAREAAESHQKFLDKLHETQAQRVPEQDKLAQAQLDLSNARDKLAEIEAHDKLVREGRLVGRGRTDMIALDEARAAVATAEKVAAQLQRSADQEHKKAGEQTAEQWLEGFKERFARAGIPELQALITELQTRIATGGAKAAEKFGALLNEAVNQLLAATPRASDILHPGSLGRAAAQRGQVIRFPEFGQTPLVTTPPAGFNPPVFGGGPPRPGSQQALFQQSLAAAEQARYNEALEHTRAILVRAQTPQQVFNLGMADLQFALDHGAISADQFHDGVQRLNKDLEIATKRSNVLGVSIVNAVSGALMAIASGGGTGGFLSAIGGLVGFVNPLIGAGIAGIGGIISASQSRGVTINSYDQKALDQLKALDNGPIRLDFSIFSATTGELIDRVLYEIGQRQRTNPVRRALPGLVFAGG